MAFIKRFTTNTTQSLFAGSDSTLGDVDGPALTTARFTDLHDIAYTWDDTQRKQLNMGNRFYAMDSNKFRMVHACEDNVLAQFPIAFNLYVEDHVLLTSRTIDFNTDYPETSFHNPRNFFSWNNDRTIHAGDYMMAFMKTFDSSSAAPTATSNWDLQLASIIEPAGPPHHFMFAWDRTATATDADNVTWTWSQQVHHTVQIIVAHHPYYALEAGDHTDFDTAVRTSYSTTIPSGGIGAVLYVVTRGGSSWRNNGDGYFWGTIGGTTIVNSEGSWALGAVFFQGPGPHNVSISSSGGTSIAGIYWHDINIASN